LKRLVEVEEELHVYKRVLSDHRVAAIKKLEEASQAEED
jgi:hypothetical protein